MRWVFIFALALLFCSPGMAETRVSGGNVSGSWSIAGSPYLLDGDVVVIDLEIGPGVSVLATGPYSIRVSGRLRAVGTEENRILFSVLADSTSSWKGLEFDGIQDGSLLQYCNVEHSNNGAIRINNCSPLIEHCRIAHNSSTSGGGLLVTSTTGRNFTMRHCQIDSNKVTGNGGGLYASIAGGTCAIESCTFFANDARPSGYGQSSGGGAYLTGEGLFEISDSQFHANTLRSYNYMDAVGRGGGIFLSNANAEINRCTFVANQISAAHVNYYATDYTYGSALNLHGTCEVAVNNSSFAYNSQSSAHRQGCIAITGGESSISNCAIAFNQNHGIYASGGTAAVTNSHLWGNLSGGAQYSGAMSISYSNVQNWLPMPDPVTHNLDQNPVFMDERLESLDLGIASVSPCVDAGSPLFGAADRYFPNAQGGLRNDIGIAGGPHAFNPDLDMIQVTDVSNDQGGEIAVSWEAFTEDDDSAPTPISFYHVQIVDPGWATPVSWTSVQTVPATRADGYAVNVAVLETFDAYASDSYLANTTWPAYLVRVVGVAEGGETEFLSNTNIGMAIDNIVPAAPTVLLSDSIDLRQLLQISVDLEATPDYRETCIFRGDILSMNPYVLGEATLWDEPCTLYEAPPIEPCSSETGLKIWTECHRGLYYYVARHVDVHGNYGAPGDTLLPNYPTPVEDSPRPLEFVVSQNVPNPFNPTTTISFVLPEQSQVSLDIYGVDGKRVANLVNEVLPAGTHESVWNGRNTDGCSAASGVYFYRVQAGTHVATERMVLLR